MEGALQGESASRSEGVGWGVTLCGPLSVCLNGRELEREFPGRQGRLVFAYLASRYPESVRREELLSLLWPGPPTEASRNALNAILSKLKKALGPGVLEGRDPLRLALPEGARVDLAVAQEATQRAEAQLATGQAKAALKIASRALAILDGGFLDGLEADWIEERRGAIAELRLRALEAAGRSALTLGGEHLEEALHRSKALVAAAPFRESGHRLLMEAMAVGGDRAGALRVYEQLEEQLADELGTEPARETQALRDRLEHGRLDEGTAPPRILPAVLERADTGTFVGREEAMAFLEQTWAQAREGVRLVALAGEPGIGKTRLAARFAALRHAQGARVLYGRCEEDGAPFEPFAQALAPIAGESVVPRLGPLAAEIFRILPGSGGQPDPQGALDGTERFRLFTAVDELIAAAASDAPLLIVLDDLHWADSPTLALLRHAARSVMRGPVMLLVTHRDADGAPGDPLAALISDLRREGLVDRVRLEGLSEEAVANLIAAALGAEPDPLAVRRVIERTGGNAFFISELVREAMANEALDPGTAISGLAAPDAVKVLIGRRLEEQPEGVATVLAAAAVLGREADLRALERLPDLEGHDVLGALEAALSAGLAMEVPGAPGRFYFTHALVRDALYETLSAARRSRLHAQAADALEASGSPPSEVARHLLAAGPAGGLERTVSALRRAGDEARAQSAYEAAARHFEAALALAQRLGRSVEEHCDLVLAAGEARQCAGEIAEARGGFARAAELARTAGDPNRLAAAALGMRGPYGETGVVDREAIALLEEALEMLGPQGDGVRAMVEAGLARALYWTGDLSRVDDLSAAALEEAQLSGNPQVLALALDARHEVLRHPRHLGVRLQIVQMVLDRARELGDRALAAQAHQMRAVDLLESGDRDAAERDLAAVARLARELRQPLFERYHAMWGVMRAHMEGRLDEAEARAHDTLAVALRAGARDAVQGFAVQLFCILRYRGGVAGMRATAEALAAEYPDMAVWRGGLALICAEAGDEKAARESLGKLAGDDFASVPEDSFWVVALMLAAEVCHMVQDEHRADVLSRTLEPYGDRVVLARGAVSFGPLARPVGLAHAAAGRLEEADRWLVRAEEIARRLRAPTFEIHARVDRARVLGDDALLAQAREEARRLGLHRLAAET